MFRILQIGIAIKVKFNSLSMNSVRHLRDDFSVVSG